ncbi:MAG: hypothetical protein QOG69_2119 [Actinomycetota bacterium]|jgi:hypothetical protein|nr:hypothetical protein [Actinomycetota bacterium]
MQPSETEDALPSGSIEGWERSGSPNHGLALHPQRQPSASLAAVPGSRGTNRRTILTARVTDVIDFARLLTRHPGVWPEETIQSLLRRLGSPRGRYRWLLEEVLAYSTVNHFGPRALYDLVDPCSFLAGPLMSGSEPPSA